MIKINELRQGNLVLFKGEVASWDWSLMADGANVMFDRSGSEVAIDPIPISEELLFGFGFKKGDNGYGGYWGYSNGHMELDNQFQIVLYDGRMDDPDTKEYCPALEYAHQLQNFYFALTGNDLILNES